MLDKESRESQINRLLCDVLYKPQIAVGKFMA